MLGKIFLEEQLKQSKLAYKNSKYAPYKAEHKKSIRFWSKELKKI